MIEVGLRNCGWPSSSGCPTVPFVSFVPFTVFKFLLKMVQADV